MAVQLSIASIAVRMGHGSVRCTF